MKISRIQRILRAHQLLQSGRAFSPDELATRLNISKRTLFRDLNTLEHAGFPCKFDRAANRYAIQSDRLMPPLHFTTSEALVLLTLVRKLLHTNMIPDQRPALTAGLKIESLLPATLMEYCGPLLDNIEIRKTAQSDGHPISDTFAFLQRSVAARLKIRVLYDSYSPRARIHTTLRIYRIAFIQRGWYVIGFSEKHNEVRTFKVERFIHIEVTDKSYKIEPGFSLDDYFGNAWCMIREPRRHHVRVEFSRMVAGNVDEVRWHKSQRITRNSDGTLLFEANVDGLREISWWILGYGDQAKVIGPRQLRQMVLDRAQGIVAHYNGQPDSE